MKPMALAELCSYLHCPSCKTGSIEPAGSGLACRDCHRSYPIHEGVVDFVLHDQLGETERRELKAINGLTDDDEKVQWLIDKEIWDRIGTHFHNKAIRAAAKLLLPYAKEGKTLCTVGSGTGFELRMLEKYVTFAKIIASDISWNAASAIAKSIRTPSGSLGLLACDFQKCPMTFSPDTVGFVYEALHHCDDVHRTIDILLNHFDQLVIVEPTRNWLMNALNPFGLSMNIEYSGLKPDWIDLKKLSKLARQRGYSMNASTWWPCPDWLVPPLFRRVAFLGYGLCLGVDAISALTKPFKFGGMSIVHFRKQLQQVGETTCYQGRGGKPDFCFDLE